MRILRRKLSHGLYVEHLHVGASVAAVVLEPFILKPVRLGSKLYLYHSLLVFIMTKTTKLSQIQFSHPVQWG